MNISIIGYNIFSSGGTTRSNMNVMYEFLDHGAEITYYNFVDYGYMDLVALHYENPKLKQVSFCLFNKLLEEETIQSDYYYISREAFFPLVKILRLKFPTAKIIGEIHGPLDLIQMDIGKYLPYFDAIRVGTESIRQNFIKRYQFEHVFTQTVSLYHIEPVKLVDTKKTKNLLIYARFDEQSKDISYAIRLMDYVVHYLKQADVHLYINGYGVGERLYKNLINYYHLSKNIHINQRIPKNYIYLSTSHYETFGYSIMEALANGNHVLLYPGNDDVVKEVYQTFQQVTWLKKELSVDGQTLVTLIEKQPQQQAFLNDKKLIQQLKVNYVAQFLTNTSDKVSYLPEIPKEVSIQEVQQLLNESDNATNLNDELKSYRLMYYQLKKYPFIGRIVRTDPFRNMSKYCLESILKRLKKPQNDYEEELNPHCYFFESFHGKNFSGDPKYLALAIKKRDTQSTIFVSSVNQLVDMEIRSYGFIPLRMGSKEYVRKFSICKYIFINGNSLDVAGKRTEQKFIQTWHGFPIKKMINDLENPSERRTESEAFRPRMKKWDYLLTSGSYHTSLLCSAFALKDNRLVKVLETGAPRNAYLINMKENQVEKERIYWKYFNRPYESEKLFVLFCPTWRKGERKKVSQVDLKEVLEHLPPNYEIIVKLHPLEGSLRKYYATLDQRIHCFFNELVDIQELYLLSQVLITDYSSAIFDYAHLNRKIIVMQEDAQQYQKEVGWYFDLEKECALIGATYTSEELAIKIKENETMNVEVQMTQKLLSKDTQKSIEMCLDKILEKEVYF